jgi:hypothetical protein
VSRALRLGVALLCACFLTGNLCAQAGTARHVTWSLGASGAHQLTRSQLGSTTTRFSGPWFGGEAAVRYRDFAGRLRYGEGRAGNDSTERDVVEGEGLIGYSIRPWLEVWVGPHARTFVVPDLSDRRWLFWSGRVLARGSPFPGRVDSFVEGWLAFDGTLSRPDSPASGEGLEAGLEVRLARPWWSRIAYRYEQGRVADGPRETYEAFTLTVRYEP